MPDTPAALYRVHYPDGSIRLLPAAEVDLVRASEHGHRCLIEPLPEPVTE